MSPRAFENLSYDLLVMLGIRNLVWRTPGADGGRDLEGINVHTDFAGGINPDKWYFECKRYGAAVPWPTVFEKIAYAANQGADYLLFLTTSSFSPQCEDEVANWNAKGGRPKVRQWPGHYMAELVSSQPKIVTKYKLTDGVQAGAVASVMNLANELAKAVQASYAAEEFGSSASPQTVFASALADLLTATIADIETQMVKSERIFRIDKDGFDWLRVDGSPRADREALRAILTALRLQFPESELSLEFAIDAIRVRWDSGSSKSQVLEGLKSSITEICFWADLEPNFDDGLLTLRDRRDEE